MPENTAHTTRTQTSADAAAAPGDSRATYASKPSRLAPWHQRLQGHKITPRKIALYVLVLVIVILSSPILPTFIIGCILVAAGIALRIWTFGHLEKNDSMITTGPYAHTRNPAYLGSFVIFAGFIVAAGNPFSAAGILVWALGLIAVAVFFASYLPRKYAREYPRLEQAFPEGFKAHAAHVPDFFPRLTPWRSGDTRSFSWTCVRANHEIWWPVMLTLGLAVVWLV